MRMTNRKAKFIPEIKEAICSYNIRLAGGRDMVTTGINKRSVEYFVWSCTF